MIQACGEGNSPRVFTLDVRDGSAQTKIQAAPADRAFLLLPFSTTQTLGSGAKAFSLSRTEVASKARSNRTRYLGSSRLGPQVSKGLYERIRAKAQRQARTRAYVEEAFLQKEAHLATYQQFYTSPRQLEAPPENLEISSPFAGDGNATIAGVLRASSKQAALYVDSRVNASVADSVVEALFSGYDQITLPRVHVLFGQESDLDNNGVIFLFVTSQELMNENVLGFFRPADLLPNGAVVGNPSNEREILYATVPGPNVSIQLGQATLAHETWHLINFSQKTLPLFRKSGGRLFQLESLFLNEGMAHLTEELVGWGIDSAPLASIYLQCMEYSSLAAGGSANAPSPCDIVAAGNDSLPRRGGAMLFLLYLFQQMGGAIYSETEAGDISGEGVAFLQALARSPDVGLENIEKASERSFYVWYADFAAMLALDNTGLTQDSRYLLEPIYSDPFTFLARNLRIRMTLRFGNQTTELSGPAVLAELSGSSLADQPFSLFPSGAQALRLTLPANETIDLLVSGDTTLEMGMTVVQVQ